MGRQDKVRGGWSQESHQVGARADVALLCHFGGCDRFPWQQKVLDESSRASKGPLSCGKLRYLGSVGEGVEVTMLEPSPEEPWALGLDPADRAAPPRGKLHPQPLPNNPTQVGLSSIPSQAQPQTHLSSTQVPALSQPSLTPTFN